MHPETQDLLESSLRGKLVKRPKTGKSYLIQWTFPHQTQNNLWCQSLPMLCPYYQRNIESLFLPHCTVPSIVIFSMEIALPNAHIGILRHGQDLLIDCSGATQSAVSCLTSDKCTACLRLSKAKEEVHQVDVGFGSLHVVYHSLGSMCDD